MSAIFDRLFKRSSHRSPFEAYLRSEKKIVAALDRREDYRLTVDGLDPTKVFRSGFDAFCRTGRTEHDAYVAMRQLHMLTKGRSDAIYANAASRIFPAVDHSASVDSRFFGPIAADASRQLTDALQDDGIAFLPSLRKDVVDSINGSLQGLPVTDNDGKEVGHFPNFDDTPRVFFAERDLLKIEWIRALAIDPLLVMIARKQLGLEPVFLSANVFHTRPHSGDDAALSNTAQMYHIDRDRLTFINFFIYLSDVGEENGPHCFVKTSHAKRPDSYWQDRRFSDEEIAEVYSADKILAVTGPAGTGFAANTSAFHKGSPPVKGSRTILEFIYTSSLFGAEFNTYEDDPFNLESKRLSKAEAPASRLLLRFGRH